MTTAKVQKYIDDILENLNAQEMIKLVSELEDQIEAKQEQEEKEYQANWEEDPADVVARENCLAFMD